MSETIVNHTEAREEARRLTKVHGRSVEVKTSQCCDYDRSCGCGGQGYRFDLVFASCDHEVGDGDLVECDEHGCAERERSDGPDRIEFKAVGQQVESCREVQSEREAEEAA